MKKKITKYLRKRRLLALWKITRHKFLEAPGDNFPAFALK